MAGKLARKTAALDKLRQRASADPDREPEFAAALVELADDLGQAGRTQEALARVREARQIYEDRVREWHPDELLVAACMGREATWLAEAGDAGAERLFAEEAAIYLDLVRNVRAGAVMDMLMRLQGVVQGNLSARSYRSAEGAARACIELAQRIVGQDLSAESYIVNIRNSLVLSLGGQGKFAEAYREARRSVEIAQQAGMRGRLGDGEGMAMALTLLKWASEGDRLAHFPLGLALLRVRAREAALARSPEMVDDSTIEVPVPGGVAAMPKRLIVCCDGTWNTADQVISGNPCPTNVTKLALSLASEDAAGSRQCVYYHPGVGTSRRERLSGGAFGVGLSRNVADAYRFLVDNYEPGDLLYLFGFSRGAFTARSLAGLIRNSGILRRENAGRIDQAWTLYRSSADTPRGVAATLFRRAYSYEPLIHFIGVWDTVGALGIPALGPRWLEPVVARLNHRWEFHDTKLSTKVKGAFHALAIDERRAAFAPTLWHQQPGADGQELKQVWFTGVHCDVGGGYPDSSLSDITLLWMADRAREYGLEFVPGAFSADGPTQMTPGDSIDFKVDPRPMTSPHSSWTKFYRLIRPLNRPIGTAQDEQHHLDGHEYLAASAREHYEADPGYRPPALVTYLSNPAGVHLEPVPEKAWP